MDLSSKTKNRYECIISSTLSLNEFENKCRTIIVFLFWNEYKYSLSQPSDPPSFVFHHIVNHSHCLHSPVTHTAIL